MDTWIAIVGHIDCGSAYKALCLTDKLRRDVVMRVHPTADTKFANHLLTLITMIESKKYVPAAFRDPNKFPGSIWDIDEISGNPNTTLALIDSRPEGDWDWPIVAMRNPNITTDWLENLGDRGDFDGLSVWDWVSCNSCITIGYVLANPALPWNWIALSANPSITMKDIKDHPELPWVYGARLNNPNVTWDVIYGMFETEDGMFSEYSDHSCVTIDVVKKYPNLPWDYSDLTTNPNMTMTIIKDNPNIPWDMNSFTLNPNVTIEDVIANPQIRWSWPHLSINPNMTLEIIKAHPEFPWKVALLQSNPSITWADVEANSKGIHGKKWKLSEMGGKPDLTWKKIVELDSVVKWNWIHIASNTFGMPETVRATVVLDSDAMWARVRDVVIQNMVG